MCVSFPAAKFPAGHRSFKLLTASGLLDCAAKAVSKKHFVALNTQENWGNRGYRESVKMYYDVCFFLLRFINTKLKKIHRQIKWKGQSIQGHQFSLSTLPMVSKIQVLEVAYFDNLASPTISFFTKFAWACCDYLKRKIGEIKNRFVFHSLRFFSTAQM